LLPTKELLKIFFTFYKFMALAYASGPPIERLYLSNANDITQNGKPYRIRLLFSATYRNPKYVTGRNEVDFLFGYKNVNNSFEKIISTWFKLYHEISPCINILNDFLLKKKFSADVKILQITKALESFHREKRTLSPSANDLKKQKKYSQLLSAAPAFKTWLADMFRYSFEPKVKRRLIALFLELPRPVLQDLNLDTPSKRKYLAEKAKVTRNYYSHFGTDLAKLKMDGIVLIRAIEKLKVCLICLLSKKLGFSDEQIVNMVRSATLYPFST
ncbi:MAG: HEPN domain-containing protein, partial [Chitinophagaceae bacterium]